MLDPTPSTRQQGTKQGKKHSNQHAETKQTPLTEKAKNGPKAHPHEKEGNTATARRQPQAETHTQPSQSPQPLTGGQARLQAGTQGGTEEIAKNTHGTANKSRSRGMKVLKAIGAKKQPKAQTRMTKRHTRGH